MCVHPFPANVFSLQIVSALIIDDWEGVCEVASVAAAKDGFLDQFS